MLWGLVCTSCKRQFREGALWEQCRACMRSVVAMDPEDVATAVYVDDEFPYQRRPPYPKHDAVLAEASALCGFDVADQVHHVARSLERVITAVPSASHELRFLVWRIEQRCPICRIGIAVTFGAREIPTVDALFHAMFELFDEHRCLVSPARVAEMRARADRESDRMAQRAVAIRAREQAEPPRGPSLYERAERESVVLAEWALAFAG